MGRDGSDDRSAVLERTQEFLAALRATPALQDFAAAKERFRTDPEVQRIMAELQRRVETFQRAQQAGTLREEQIREVREAQTRFQRHPLVREFVETRDAAGTFLQETNRVISEILGFDFGQTAGPAGGAC